MSFMDLPYPERAKTLDILREYSSLLNDTSEFFRAIEIQRLHRVEHKSSTIQTLTYENLDIPTQVEIHTGDIDSITVSTDFRSDSTDPSLSIDFDSPTRKYTISRRLDDTKADFKDTVFNKERAKNVADSTYEVPGLKESEIAAVIYQLAFPDRMPLDTSRQDIDLLEADTLRAISEILGDKATSTDAIEMYGFENGDASLFRYTDNDNVDTVTIDYYNDRIGKQIYVNHTFQNGLHINFETTDTVLKSAKRLKLFNKETKLKINLDLPVGEVITPTSKRTPFYPTAGDIIAYKKIINFETEQLYRKAGVETLDPLAMDLEISGPDAYIGDIRVEPGGGIIAGLEFDTDAYLDFPEWNPPKEE